MSVLKPKVHDTFSLRHGENVTISTWDHDGLEPKYIIMARSVDVPGPMGKSDTYLNNPLPYALIAMQRRASGWCWLPFTQPTKESFVDMFLKYDFPKDEWLALDIVLAD